MGDIFRLGREVRATGTAQTSYSIASAMGQKIALHCVLVVLKCLMNDIKS